MRALLCTSFALICLTLPACDRAPTAPGATSASAPTFQQNGTLTLTIDSQPAEWAVNWTGLLNTDDGYPDGLEVNGERLHLVGSFDLDLDGDTDEDDTLPYDDTENIVPASMIGKRVVLDAADSTLTLADGRQFAVESGAFTIRTYAVGADTVDRLTADVVLSLRLEGRSRPATGTLDTGAIGIW